MAVGDAHIGMHTAQRAGNDRTEDGEQQADRETQQRQDERDERDADGDGVPAGRIGMVVRGP